MAARQQCFTPLLTLRSAIAACGLVAISGLAAAECRDDWICVDTISTGNKIEFRARNLGNFPITYTLKISGGRELRADSTSTVTRTLGPRESEQVMHSPGTTPGTEGGYRIAYDWTVGDKDAVHDDDYLYALPYQRGARHRILQGYGSRFSHTGLEEYAVDFDMPEGTSVHAARSGVVARVEESNDRGCWQAGCGRFANYIVILHSDGTTGEYYHLKRDGAVVAVGDSIAQGQKIGYSGNTGHSTMPHLHFAVYRAVEWGNTQSIPVRFRSAEGIINRPRRGARYEAF